MKLEEFLNDRRIRFDVLRHDDTFDSQHLAESVHVSGRQIAKTVLLRMDHGYHYAVAILPATHLIDLEAVAKLLGGARMELATEYEIAHAAPIAKQAFCLRSARCMGWRPCSTNRSAMPSKSSSKPTAIMKRSAWPAKIS